MNDSKCKFHGPLMFRTRFCQGIVRFVPATYENGNKALQLIDAETGEPMMRPSINLGIEVGSTEMAIKDYAENEGAWQALVQVGFIHPAPLRHMNSGHVRIPIACLTAEAMKFYDNMKPRDLQREFMAADLTEAMQTVILEAAYSIARVMAVVEALGKDDATKLSGKRKARRALYTSYQMFLPVVRAEVQKRKDMADKLEQALNKMEGRPK